MTTPSDGGVDVIVLPKALAYRADMTRPTWERVGLRTFGLTGQGAKYVLAFTAGGILTQFVSEVIWPWLKGLFGLSP
jgi:hypothetical protein